MIGTGTIIGELIGIEQGFERFGEWLKRKTGNSGDASFVNAFVTATLTLSIGAMAIVGALQDGLLGDYSTLAVKSVLDFIIVAVMTSSLGKGAAFSAIPVFILEGGITLLAKVVSPVMTPTAIAYLSFNGRIFRQKRENFSRWRWALLPKSLYEKIFGRKRENFYDHRGFVI